MSDLTAKVLRALDLRGHSDVANGVKDAVIDELVDADPSLTVTKTNYFNHSFIPDLVASWNEAGESRTREFFFRFDVETVETADEIARLAAGGPAFLRVPGGAGVVDPDAARTDHLVEAALETNRHTLVADAEALEDLAGAVSANTLEGLVPQAFVRGGRGYVDQTKGEALVTAAVNGFAASARNDLEGTRSALRDIRSNLIDEYATEIERSAGLLWIGGGGEPEDFPAPVDLDGALAPRSLQRILGVLLNGDASYDDVFWRRLSDWVDEDDLLAVGPIGPSDALRALLKWKAPYLRFVSMAAETNERTRGYAWSIVDGPSLRLHVPGHTLDFVRDGRKHNMIGHRRDPITWDTLQHRVERHHLSSAEFRTESVTVKVDAVGSASVTEDTDLVQEMTQLSGGRATEAVVTLRGGGRLKCDLERQVATSVGTVQRPMLQLGAVGSAVLLGTRAGTLQPILDALGCDEWGSPMSVDE